MTFAEFKARHPTMDVPDLVDAYRAMCAVVTELYPGRVTYLPDRSAQRAADDRVYLEFGWGA